VNNKVFTPHADMYHIMKLPVKLLIPILIITLVLFFNITCQTKKTLVIEEAPQEDIISKETRSSAPCIPDYTPIEGEFVTCNHYKIRGVLEVQKPEHLYIYLYLDKNEYTRLFPEGPFPPPAVSSMQKKCYTVFVTAYAEQSGIAITAVPENIRERIHQFVARGIIDEWEFLGGHTVGYYYSLFGNELGTNVVTFFDSLRIPEITG